MGYTHYWAYLPEHDQFRRWWPRMVLDAKTILDHIQTVELIDIRGATGVGTPLLTEGAIGFNGDQTADADFESFWLPYAAPDPIAEPDLAAEYRTLGFAWSFCKTAGKPYDVAVCVVLLRCHFHAPDVFAIGSDGNWDRDWSMPRAVYTDLFGEPGDTNPLTDARRGPRATHTPTQVTLDTP